MIRAYAAGMTVGTGAFAYEWIDDWLRVPPTDNGRTHAAAVTRGGDVIVFHQASPAVLVCDADGTIKDRWGDYPGAHGLTLVEEGGRDILWLTDQDSAVVRKHGLDGEVLGELPRPEALAPSPGREGKYVPTWAAVAPDGDVWVADGYGSYGVYRYAPDGRLKQTITGEEGAGRFESPHGLAFSPRGELWITDRANARVCVYDVEGRPLRHRDGLCHSPCCFAFREAGGRVEVYVPELFTGLKVIDEQLNLLAEVGASDEVGPQPDGGRPPITPAGWPNLAGTEHVKPGVFNSPHGVAVSPAGEVYVTEWIVGGRVTKLVPTR